MQTKIISFEEQKQKSKIKDSLLTLKEATEVLTDNSNLDNMFAYKYRHITSKFDTDAKVCLNEVSMIMREIIPHMFNGSYEERYFANMDYEDFFEKYFEKQLCRIADRKPESEFMKLYKENTRHSAEQIQNLLMQEMTEINICQKEEITNHWGMILYLNYEIFELFSDELDKRVNDNKPSLDFQNRMNWIFVKQQARH